MPGGGDRAEAPHTGEGEECLDAQRLGVPRVAGGEAGGAKRSKARRLPALAVRAARARLAARRAREGRAHGGPGGDADARGDAETTSDAKANARTTRESIAGKPVTSRRRRTRWDAYMGGGVFVSRSRADRDPAGDSKRESDSRNKKIPRALLDEAVTLLFAGHDTQSATLSWALLRLAAEPEIQKDLRARLSRADRRRRARRRAPKNAERRRRRNRVRIVCGARLHSSPRERVYAPARVAHIRSRARARGRAPRDPASAPGGASGGAAPDFGRRRRRRLLAAGGHRRRRVAARRAQGPRGVGPAGRVRAAQVAGGRRGLPTPNAPRRGADEEPPRVRRKGSAFMPFAAGPRACVGQHLAWVFMRVMLAQLVCAFEFAPGVERDPMTPSVGFTVTPANGAEGQGAASRQSAQHHLLFHHQFFFQLLCARGKAFRADLPFARVCLDDTRVVWSPTPASASRWCFTSHHRGGDHEAQTVHGQRQGGERGPD